MQTGIDVVLRMHDRATREVGGALRGIERTATRIAGVLGLAFSVRAIAQFTAESVRLAQQQEAAERKLQSVLTATGAAAGYTLHELKTMASALQDITTYGDEVVLSMQSVLATFTKIRGPIFAEATERILDMATILGTDLQAAALQVGKALNDPVAGITALRRSGVSFTSSQEALIKSLMATNDVLGAQRIILAELNTEFGGAARAEVNSYEGAIKQLKNTWGDFREELGRSATESPAIQAFLHDLTESVKSLTQGLKELRVVGIDLGEWVTDPRLGLPFMWPGVVGSAGLEMWARLTAAESEKFSIGPTQKALLNISGVPTPELDEAEGYWDAQLKRNQELVKALRKRREEQQEIAANAVLEEHERQQEIVRAEQERYRAGLDLAREHEIELQRINAEAVIAEHELQAAAIRAEQAQRDRQLEIGRAWLGDLRETYREFYRDFAQGIGNAFADALVSGRNFVDSMKALLQDLARSAISFGISRTFLAAFPAPESAASVYYPHGGGVIGADAIRIAPRFHGGGLASDEVPAVLQRGEGVFTPAQMQAMGGPVQINVYNQSGAPVERRERRLPGGGVSVDLVVGKMGAKDLATRGPLSQTLERVYGLRRVGAV